MSITKKKAKEIADYYCQFGLRQTCDDYGLKEESILRYIRTAKNDYGIDVDKNRTLVKLCKRFSEDELKSILKGSIIKNDNECETIKFDGEEVTFCHLTDTHIGSKFFKKHYLESCFEECYKQNVDFMFHTGDLVEGMSNRPDQIYSLTHIGYDAQKEYAVELFKPFEKKVYIIDGNHDRWFLKSNGALIVKDISKELSNFVFLGHDTGKIKINNVVIEGFHGEDGSSYAISYRIQKLIESMAGGEKPQILLTGHVHKAGYFFIRNIHSILGGACSWQSDWMRSTRKENHAGFWIVKATIADDEVKSFMPRWYPFYK